MLSFKLKQLRRLISKFAGLVLVGLIIAVAFKNQASFKLPLTDNLARLLKSPYNLVVNQKTAIDFKTVEEDLSRQFITRVKSLSSESDWLQFQDQLDKLKSQSQNNQAKLNYWLLADQKYTNFSAIKLLLASLYYQQGDKQTALTYLEQARKLDPNNKLLQILSKTIN